MTGKKLVLIVVDGMTPAAFERAVESGRAPALALLAARGAYRRATSVFPSLTPVCLSSIATGSGPDVHRIPHLVWWHREERRIVEYGSSFAALRAAGKGDGAKEIARRRRPPVSAWAVNQLYWHERETFDALLAAAARLRKGDLKETGAYREALREAHRRAAAILGKSPHAPTDATMRRVMGTLAAVAASGSFDPDPPGALTADREPPGFEAIDALAASGPARKRDAKPERLEDQKRKQAEAKARQAERQRIVAALREAQAAVRDRERASALLKKELHAAEKAVEDARDAVLDLERKLETLDDTD